MLLKYIYNINQKEMFKKKTQYLIEKVKPEKNVKF